MLRRILFAALPLLLLAFSAPASAQMVWGLSAWSAGLGFVKPENIDGTFWLDGGVEFARVNENITLDGRLMYWGSSVGSGDAKLDFSDIAILPGGTYRFPANGSITPLARAGLGIHRFKVEVPTVSGSIFNPTVSTTSATNTEFGVYFGGGAAFQAGEKIEILGIAEFHVMDATFFVLGAEARIPIGG